MRIYTKVAKLTETAKQNAMAVGEDLLRLYNQPYFSQDCKELLELILEWHSVNSKGDGRYQYLWEMWHTALNVECPYGFMESLRSFFSHDLLDDGGYEIKWTKPYVNTEGRIEWDNSTYGYKYVECSQDDPDTLPQVYRSYSDNSLSNPRHLIEAMREAEARQLAKARKREQDANFIKQAYAEMHREKP